MRMMAPRTAHMCIRLLASGLLSTSKREQNPTLIAGACPNRSRGRIQVHHAAVIAEASAGGVTGVGYTYAAAEGMSTHHVSKVAKIAIPRACRAKHLGWS